MYVTNAALTFRERTRRAVVLPLPLGPHGSNFLRVCAALQSSLLLLKKGLTLKIKGEDVSWLPNTTLSCVAFPFPRLWQVAEPVTLSEEL